MLTRLAAEAEADVADLYTEAGGLKPIHEWPKIWRQGLVAGIDIEQIKGPDGSVAGDMVKIKLSDRLTGTPTAEAVPRIGKLKLSELRKVKNG